MDAKEQELIEALDVAKRKDVEAFRKWGETLKVREYRNWVEAYSNWVDAGYKLWWCQKSSKAQQCRKAGE